MIALLEIFCSLSIVSKFIPYLFSLVLQFLQKVLLDIQEENGQVNSIEALFYLVLFDSCKIIWFGYKYHFDSHTLTKDGNIILQ